MRVMKPVDADEALWERNGLFWTEDNRLYSVIGEKVFSYYTYDDSGERRLKAYGSLTVDDKNADRYFYASFLDSLTLYPSPYLVVDGNGYTKHYYAGAERVCAKLGGGGFDGEETVLTYDAPLSIISKNLFYGCMQQSESRSLPDNIPECITTDDGRDFVYNQKIDGLPQSVKIGVEMQPSSILYVVEKYGPVLRPEDEVYYYHSDHLGSASWISDYEGSAIQHLRYMPFGQPLRNERLSGYNERFTFSGKERDAETSLSYFGARYYDADLLTGWLSVDPMSDKYPSINPYAYCAGSPLAIADPNGDTLDIKGGDVAQNDIKSIVRPDFRDRIGFDGSRVCVNTEGLSRSEISSDAGFFTLYNLVNSSENVLYQAEDVVDDDGELILLQNHSKTPHLEGQRRGQPLPEGYSGHVIINPNIEFLGMVDGKEEWSAIRASVVFHELEENYQRTVRGLPYMYLSTIQLSNGRSNSVEDRIYRLGAHRMAQRNALRLTPSARSVFGVEGEAIRIRIRN